MTGPRSSLRSRRPLVLLALGALAGLGLAAVEILRTGSESLPVGGGLAQVNGIPIRAEAYQRLLSGLESDLRRPATAAERDRVLDRMIEEELLVQRGLELGLARHDRRVRGDLVAAVIGAVTTDAEARQPDAGELRRFYAENRDFFTQPGRVRVRQIFLRVPAPEREQEVRARAVRAAERLRSGEPFETVARELGDEALPELPDALLPPAKLREYLGPTALRAALELGRGAVSDPVRSGTGVHVLQLLEREPPHAPDFEQIEEQVRAEWRRREGDRALRSYLDDLRERSDVRVAETRP